ncbi:MAG: hypothetical protein AAFO51_03505, partial [Pseudomonadota bacterium]
ARQQPARPRHALICAGELNSEFDVRVAETARDLLAEIQCSDSSAISPEEMPEQPVLIEPVSLRIDPAPPLRAE